MDKLKLALAIFKKRKQVGLVILLAFGLARAVASLTCPDADTCKALSAVEKAEATVANFVALFGIDGPAPVAGSGPDFPGIEGGEQAP